MGFLFLVPFALDELEDVGVPNFQRLHLGRPAGLATRFDHAGDRVIHLHERQRTGRGAAAGEFFAAGPDCRQIGSGAAAEFEQHRFAGRQPHDVFHVVVDVLNETRRALRKLIRVFRLGGRLGGVVPVPIAFVADDAVLVV